MEATNIFRFDKQMNKNILFSIIESIEAAGVQVTAIVLDLGGSQTLWKELQISESNCFFLQFFKPIIKNMGFAHMSHYIKLLWNHYLDKEFLLGDGTIIDPSIAREVLERDEGEIKLCYKLKSQILTVKGNERQSCSCKNFILRDNSKNNQTFNWEWIEHQISF